MDDYIGESYYSESESSMSNISENPNEHSALEDSMDKPSVLQPDPSV